MSAPVKTSDGYWSIQYSLQLPSHLILTLIGPQHCYLRTIRYGNLNSLCVRWLCFVRPCPLKSNVLLVLCCCFLQPMSLARAAAAALAVAAQTAKKQQWFAQDGQGQHRPLLWSRLHKPISAFLACVCVYLEKLLFLLTMNLSSL